MPCSIRACALSLLLLPAVLLAGKITLKDGTVYEGTIRKYGTMYGVKLPDGTTKMVSEKDVKDVDDPALGGGAAGGATPTTPGGTPAGPVTPGKAGGAEFQKATREAESASEPELALMVWQKFVDTHKGPDLDAGKKELDKWQKWSKDGAEKIKGQWVTGETLKKLHADVDKKLEKALTQIHGDQAIQGVKGIEEVLKIYPNSFVANFEMGFYYLNKITRMEGSNKLIDDSIKSLETANKLNPNSPSTLTNLAIAYNFRKKYVDSVMAAYKAAQLEDSPEIVQNLYNAITNAPPGMVQRHPKVVAILPDAKLLLSKHGAKPESRWIYVRPRGDDAREDPSPGRRSARKGMVGSGTGFFISDDGFIMTNRHVAEAGEKLIVVTSDGKRHVAEKIVVDDDQDIAILKVVNDVKEPLPFIRIAGYDAPNIGTDVTVMGFPLGAMMGMNVKITRGVVTAVEKDKDACDVIVDAQVNPGNSGGPMLDKHGNLLALVAMKTLSDEKVSSYGLGISPGRLRKFFEHQKDKLKALKLAEAVKTAADAKSLSTEEIAQNFTKATVMVMMFNGDVPDSLTDKDGKTDDKKAKPEKKD